MNIPTLSCYAFSDLIVGNLRDLSMHIRLHNFYIKTGASENEIESFITNVHLSNIPTEKVIEYLNQIHQIAKEESIPLDQVSDFLNLSSV
jgi:hypothetical protein